MRVHTSVSVDIAATGVLAVDDIAVSYLFFITSICLSYLLTLKIVLAQTVQERIENISNPTSTSSGRLNASIDLKPMAWHTTNRYLIERSNQDAKQESNWDECQTRTYRAWQPQLTLTMVAF